MNKLKNKFKIALFCLFTFISIQNASAKWNFSMNVGYGIGQYEKSIVAPIGTYLYKDGEDYFLALFGKEKFKINYLSDKDIAVSKEEIKYFKEINEGDRLLFSNMISTVILTGTMHTLPISISMYYEFYNKFRLGLGANISINYVKQLKITSAPFDGESLITYKDLVRKILIKKLNPDSIGGFKEAIKYMPESIMKNLDTFRDLLDPTEDSVEIEELNGIINEYKDKAVDTENSHSLEEYIPRNKINFTVDPFISLGFKFFENSNYSAIIDTQISPIVIMCNSLGNFYEIKTYTVPSMIGAYSMGLSIEKHISEYFTINYSIRYKRYNDLEPSKDALPIFNEKTYNISMQIGFSISAPEIERCPVNRCGMQIKHRHEGNRFRGENMFVGKNAMGVRLFTK